MELRINAILVTLLILCSAPTTASQLQQSPLFEDEPLAQACRFTSLSELDAEAGNVLDQFSKTKNFDPFFWEPDQTRREQERQRAVEKARLISEQRARLETDLPFAKMIFSIFDSLMTATPLNAFKAGFLGVDFSTSCDLACTQGVFIGLNQNWSRALSEKFPDSYIEIMSFVIAHEIGHNIFDYNLWYSGEFEDIGKYREHFKSLSYRKLHLTIDAIAMIMTGLSPVEVANILEKTVDGLDPDKGIGDVSRRVFCLRNLK